MLHGADQIRIKGCYTMSDVGCGKCPRLALWDVPLYNEGALDDWRLTVTSVYLGLGRESALWSSCDLKS